MSDRNVFFGQTLSFFIFPHHDNGKDGSHDIQFGQHHLGSTGRGARVLHAGRLLDVRGRIHPPEKHRQHPDEKPHGLLHRHARLFPAGLRADVRHGQRGHRLAGSGHCARLFGDPARRRAAVGVRHLPDGVLRHLGDHRFRRNGRAHALFSLLHLFGGDFAADLSDLRPLDLGRRLAFSNGLPRFRRLDGGAYGGRRVRAHRRENPRAAHRQIRQERQAARHTGA